MGAATFVIDADGGGSLANQKRVKGVLTMSSSYATSGDTLALATEVGLKSLDDMLVEASSDADVSGYQIKVGGTPASPKILAYTAGAQVANTTDLSAYVFDVWLLGT